MSPCKGRAPPPRSSGKDRRRSEWQEDNCYIIRITVILDWFLQLVCAMWQAETGAVTQIRLRPNDNVIVYDQLLDLTVLELATYGSVKRVAIYVHSVATINSLFSAKYVNTVTVTLQNFSHKSDDFLLCQITIDCTHQLMPIHLWPCKSNKSSFNLSYSPRIALHNDHALRLFIIILLTLQHWHFYRENILGPVPPSYRYGMSKRARSYPFSMHTYFQRLWRNATRSCKHSVSVLC